MVDRIKSLRGETSGAVIAKKAKITQAYFSQIELGQREPSLTVVKNLAAALGTSVAYLTGETNDPAPPLSVNMASSWKVRANLTSDSAPVFPQKEPPIKVQDIHPDDWIEVPAFSSMSEVCGGDGWDQEYIEETPEKFESLPLRWVGRVSQLPRERPFIVPVKGNSMEGAGIPNGCEILVNPGEPIERSGEVALVRYGIDNDMAVKWVYKDEDGSVEIRSATLLYPPKRFTREDIENGLFSICGKVMKVLGNPKRGE